MTLFFQNRLKDFFSTIPTHSLLKWMNPQSLFQHHTRSIHKRCSYRGHNSLRVSTMWSNRSKNCRCQRSHRLMVQGWSVTLFPVGWGWRKFQASRCVAQRRERYDDDYLMSNWMLQQQTVIGLRCQPENCRDRQIARSEAFVLSGTLDETWK